MTREEYEAKIAANQRIEGFGPEGVTVHMPCPFCAEAGFVAYKVLEVQSAMSKGAVCSSCGRGARAVFRRSHGAVQFEIVQTQGDAAPEWVRMRRIEDVRVAVAVNGAELELPLIATFADVVKAAGLEGNPSVTVHRGRGGFVFAPGQVHELENGDRISAVHTGAA